MATQTVELQRAILILQLYLSFLENGLSDLNDKERELVSVLEEHLADIIDRLDCGKYLYGQQHDERDRKTC
jgi:hypothetical protein